MDNFTDEEFKTSSLCSRCSHCVAVAHKDGTIAVRNTQDTNKTTVTFSAEEWGVFTQAIKKGEFDF